MNDDIGEQIDALIHRADLDGLVRMVDTLTTDREWPELLALRDQARRAVASGRQLWPAATLAEYRLALHAPPRWTAAVLDEGSGRLTIGPLTEVAAQAHTVADLAEFVDDPVRLGFVAHEWAIRHPDRAEEIDVPINPLEIPFRRATWEPNYPLATYSDFGLDAPSPAVPAGPTVDGDRSFEVVDDPDVSLAVRQLFDGWTASSAGRAEVICVDGGAHGAVSALGVSRASLTAIGLDDALAWLAWAGAGGGANGRRRGAATGRFGAWWLLAALCDRGDDWPIDAEQLGRDAAELSWYWWDAGEPMLGWTVQIAVADRATGNAWAISAHDAA